MPMERSGNETRAFLLDQTRKFDCVKSMVNSKGFSVSDGSLVFTAVASACRPSSCRMVLPMSFH